MKHVKFTCDRAVVDDGYETGKNRRFVRGEVTSAHLSSDKSECLYRVRNTKR
jgi:hypothetical protein